MANAHSNELQTSDDELLPRARALFPQLADQVFDALRDDRVLKLEFLGPGPAEFQLSSAPRARFASRNPFMRELPPPRVPGEHRGWMLVSDGSRGVWIGMEAGKAGLAVARGRLMGLRVLAGGGTPKVEIPPT